MIGRSAPSIETAKRDSGRAPAAPAEEDVEARLWRALGEDFLPLRDIVPPTRFPHARERLLMCRLYVGVIRSISDDYGAPLVNHADSPSFRAVGIYVMFRTMLSAPVHASDVAQALRLPRAAVLHALQNLMKHGYVERVGNAYRVTEKVNLPDLAERMQRRIDMIADTAQQLADLGRSVRGEPQAPPPGAPEPGEP